MAQLFNQDCIEILKSYPDKSIDIIITDPQYGLKQWTGKRKRRGGPVKQRGGKTLDVSAKEWGDQKWDYDIPDPKYFEEMIRVSNNQIIFGGNYFAHLLPASPCWIVWDKQNTGNFADFEMAWTSFKTAARFFRYRWNGMMQGNIQNKKLNEKRVHPTQKPVALMEWVISKYTKSGETVLDPFMGSGTTGIACANLGRKFIGVEKEKNFFDIAEERIKTAEAQTHF